MSYRGIEDFWGNCKYWVDGFYCDYSRNMLVGNKGFNNTGNGYENKGQGATANIGEYIGNIQSNKDCGFVISASNGTVTSKLYDYGCLYAGCPPAAGGDWLHGSDAGAFSFRCKYPASNTYIDVAASLAF